MTKTSLHCVYAGSMNRTLQMTYVPTGSHATVAGYQSRALRDLMRGNAVVKQKKKHARPTFSKEVVRGSRENRRTHLTTHSRIRLITKAKVFIRYTSGAPCDQRIDKMSLATLGRRRLHSYSPASDTCIASTWITNRMPNRRPSSSSSSSLSRLVDARSPLSGRLLVSRYQ